jgi:hypothetical protein
VAGEGIDFNIYDGGANGLVLEISVKDETAGVIVGVHDFNTRIHSDGTPRTGDELLEESFVHSIPNEHYVFDVYRPYEDSNTAPTDKWTDGTVRGRYQIRWKSVLHKGPYYFGLRFHQPEFGTIVLFGASTILRW